MKKENVAKLLMAFLVVLFVLMALPMGQNFFIKLAEEKLLHRALRSPSEWAERVMHCAFIGIATIFVCFFLLFTIQGKHIVKNFCHEMSNFFSVLKSKYGILCIVCVFVFLSIVFSKIIIADFQFADDMDRSYGGKRAWIGNSRYISEFLSIAIHNTFRLSDIAPLTQIISIAIMSFAVIFAAWIFCGEKFSVISLASVSLMFLSPFYVECFSYRFDSPYMTLAVLLPMFPFAVVTHYITFMFVSLVSLLLSCMCYQAGTNVYIIFTVFFALRMWSKKDSISHLIRFVGSAIFSFMVALVVFRFLFTNVHSKSEYFSISVSLSAIPDNLEKFLFYVKTFFGGWWIQFFFAICIIIAFINLVDFSKRNKIASALVVFFAFCVAFFLSLGVYLIFSQSLITSRTLIGFNIFVALVCLSCCVSDYGSKFRIVSSVCIACLVYGCVVFMFAYGNAQAKQKSYQAFRAEILLKDLNEFAKNDELVHISFSGSIGKSEAFKITRKNYPLIDASTSTPLTSGNIWNDNLLFTYNLNCVLENIPQGENLPLLKDTYYHTIYGENNKFHVVLKNTEVDY